MMAMLQLVVGLAKFFANAAATLPLITALGMIIGRRGNGRFCLWGAEKLLALSLYFSVSGPIYYIALYLSQILNFPDNTNIWAPLLEAPGMPYTTSIMVWICGSIAVFLAQGAMSPLLFNFDDASDRYKLSHVKFPFTLCLLAAFAYFLAFILVNWPFAGLPENLGWDRAAMAICRNGVRHYFMAFSAAGGLALVLAVYVFSRENPASSRQKKESIRWCALWAWIGYLPYALQSWGMILGVSFRKPLAAQMGSALHAQILSLSLLTLAMICWAIIFIFPRPLKTLAWGALALFLLGNGVPHIISICKNL